jgi:hypothetical protein
MEKAKGVGEGGEHRKGRDPKGIWQQSKCLINTWIGGQVNVERAALLGGNRPLPNSPVVSSECGRFLFFSCLHPVKLNSAFFQ